MQKKSRIFFYKRCKDPISIKNKKKINNENEPYWWSIYHYFLAFLYGIFHQDGFLQVIFRVPRDDEEFRRSLNFQTLNANVKVIAVPLAMLFQGRFLRNILKVEASASLLLLLVPWH